MRWLVALVLVLGSVSCGGDDPEPIELGSPPATYRIVYRITDGDRVMSERLVVARPFDSRRETFASDDGTGRPVTVDISTFGRASHTESAATLAVAVPPAVPGGDVRLDHVVGTEVLRRAGQRTIAGRRCQVYETGQPIRLVELIAGDAVEVCVDADGLVLEERAPDRRRVAIEVEVGLDLDPRDFVVPERTVPVLDGGGAVQGLTEDSRTPGEFWELGEERPLPWRGRYAVVPPQPDAFTDATLRGRRVATTTDVLTDGLDVIVVDRGGTLQGVDVIGEDRSSTRVDAGAVGRGALRHTAVGAEITVVQPGGRFIRVSGTVVVDVLLAVARSLHEVPGGTLTPVGDPW